MNLYRLERTLGWLSVGQLPVYVVAAQAVLYVWGLANPEIYSMLVMDPVSVIKRQEWWRVVTFLFLIPSQNPLFAMLYLYFQYWCGTALEQRWGSFPLTLFYLIGALGSIAGAFLVGHDLVGAFYLKESIFLAFAALFPNMEVLLFFILPLRVKYLAWFSWILIAAGFLRSSALYKIALLISLSNYFVFFLPQHIRDLKEWIQQRQHKRRFKNWDIK